MTDNKTYTEFIGLKVTKEEKDALKSIAVQEGFVKGDVDEPNISAMLRELIHRTLRSAGPL